MKCAQNEGKFKPRTKKSAVDSRQIPKKYAVEPLDFFAMKRNLSLLVIGEIVFAAD